MTSLPLRVLGVPLLVAGTFASGSGQRGGGMGMPRGGMGGGDIGMSRDGIGMPGSNGPSGYPRGAVPASVGGGSSPGNTHGGQLAPPGRWWNDKKYTKSLGLNGDQQKRMDAVFGQNRDVLISRYEAVQKAESRLEALTRNGKPTESALFSEIDHVAQARADLEKAHTHMLLQLRDELTPEQVGKLDDYR